jgi:GNAT superfamily N-acetyltransferase
VDAGVGYPGPVLEDPDQSWSSRAAVDGDAQWIAELRALVLRPDLERLGRFDPVRVRQRFLSAFDPAVTQVVLVDGQEAGAIAVRPDDGSLWIEHFYLRADCQGRGIGSLVLRRQLGASEDDRPFRLNVLQGSRARALYERHGFVVQRQDAVDVFMVRHPRRLLAHLVAVQPDRQRGEDHQQRQRSADHRELGVLGRPGVHQGGRVGVAEELAARGRQRRHRVPLRDRWSQRGMPWVGTKALEMNVSGKPVLIGRIGFIHLTQAAAAQVNQRKWTKRRPKFFESFSIR